MTPLYRLKLSVLEPHRPITELHRLLDVRGDLSFWDLHQAIVPLFHLNADTAWQLIITRQKTDHLGKLADCPELVASPAAPTPAQKTLHAPDSTLMTLALNAKEYLYLWLIGDGMASDVVIRIRLEKVDTADMASDPVRLIKTVGDFTPIADNATDKEFDKDFEVMLISALMLIATGGNGDPVRWQELQDNGVADELVRRNLIKPCVNPMHIVRLTAFGERELATFMEKSGLMGQ